MPLRLIQFLAVNGDRAVGVVDGDNVRILDATSSVRDLALKAISNDRSLTQEVNATEISGTESYDPIMSEGRILPPVDHPDPAHVTVAGTGLTHVASAAAREKMHTDLNSEDEGALNPSMQMFKWGFDGGKPDAGQAGVQAEWFYKGDGSAVTPPGGNYPVPDFADDMGEEPEVVGVYVIGNDGRPYRLGYAIGNEATDHVMEKKNYLYLAHSKLRHCSFGPELFVGALPEYVEGTVTLRRESEVIWSKAFATGEANMCHSLENLEFHHFKYNQFLRPGDVHVHFMGTSVASFGDGITTEIGDVFEIEIPAFGRPLINGTKVEAAKTPPGGVVALY